MSESRLWCSVCLFIAEEERPEDWAELALTIIRGHLVCEDHTHCAGPNEALNTYTRYRGRVET